MRGNCVVQKEKKKKRILVRSSITCTLQIVNLNEKLFQQIKCEFIEKKLHWVRATKDVSFRFKVLYVAWLKPYPSHKTYYSWDVASNCVINNTDGLHTISILCRQRVLFQLFIFGMNPQSHVFTCVIQFHIQIISFYKLSLTKTISWKLRSIFT